MLSSAASVQELVDNVPFWFHSIDVGEGIVTRGHKPHSLLQTEWKQLSLPDLRGKTVLDINAWDGFFAFEAEKAGALSVTALDFFMWAMDLPEHVRYWKECAASGVEPKRYDAMPYFQPDLLPGKAGFDTAHRLLRSQVRPVIGDFMTMNLEELGTFDITFFLGTLYHMENPFESLKRLARVTNEVAVIETEAMAVPGYEHHALCEFFEGAELNGDISNWWAPNEKALCGMCRAAGFQSAQPLVAPPSGSADTGGWFRSKPAEPRIQRYRAFVQARK